MIYTEYFVQRHASRRRCARCTAPSFVERLAGDLRQGRRHAGLRSQDAGLPPTAASTSGTAAGRRRRDSRRPRARRTEEKVEEAEEEARLLVPGVRRGDDDKKKKKERGAQARRAAQAGRGAAEGRAAQARRLDDRIPARPPMPFAISPATASCSNCCARAAMPRNAAAEPDLRRPGRRRQAPRRQSRWRSCVNCQCRRATDDACGVCAACTADRARRPRRRPDGRAGRHGDRSQVDQIRDVVERTGYRPFEGRRRVVIIDDADAMLGRGAERAAEDARGAAAGVDVRAGHVAAGRAAADGPFALPAAAVRPAVAGRDRGGADARSRLRDGRGACRGSGGRRQPRRGARGRYRRVRRGARGGGRRCCRPWPSRTIRAAGCDGAKLLGAAAAIGTTCAAGCGRWRRWSATSACSPRAPTSGISPTPTSSRG